MGIKLTEESKANELLVEKLKSFMAEKDLTMDDIANLIGKNTRTVWQFLNEKVRPHDNTLYKIKNLIGDRLVEKTEGMMFYLLFRRAEANREKDYLGFKSKEDMAKFIQEHKNGIRIERAIEVTKEFKLNWIVQLDAIGKSGRGRPRKEKKKAGPEQPDQEEPDEEETEMIEKPEETEKEAERKTETLMNRADSAIEAAKKAREDKEKNWELCIKCKIHKVAPSNKKKICFSCLPPKKSATLLGHESRASESKEE